jgi:hypothetical protein
LKLNLRNLQREPKEELKEEEVKEELKEEQEEEQEQDEEELGALEKGERPDPIESPPRRWSERLPAHWIARQLKKLKTHVVKRDVVADRGAAAMD